MSQAFCIVEDRNLRRVVVDGDVDLTNASAFEAAIRSAACEARRVVIDLGRCTYLDSSGLGVLIRSYNLHGDRLRIVLPRDGGPRRAFEITGLSYALPSFESLDDASRGDAAS